MSYIQILKSNYEKKLIRNPSYSLRSYARDLNLSSGVLSLILNGKRKYPLDKIHHAFDFLNLKEEDRKVFKSSIELQHTSIKKLKNNKKDILECTPQDIAQNRIFWESWESFAILNLVEISSFEKSNINEQVAKSLKISNEKADFFVDLLIKLNYIDFNEKGFAKRVVKEVSSTNDLSSEIIQKSHQNILDKAKAHLTDDIQTREYQAVTIKASREKVLGAKKLIRDFANQLSDYLEHDESDKDLAVYQLNLQLFSLTK